MNEAEPKCKFRFSLIRFVRIYKQCKKNNKTRVTFCIFCL